MGFGVFVSQFCSRHSAPAWADLRQIRTRLRGRLLHLSRQRTTLEHCARRHSELAQDAANLNERGRDA